MALRASGADERLGLDRAEHGEEAYSDGEGAILLLPDETAPAPLLTLVPTGAAATV